MKTVIFPIENLKFSYPMEGGAVLNGGDRRSETQKNQKIGNFCQVIL